MLRLRNSLFPLLRATSPLPSPIHHRVCRLVSTSTSIAIVPVPFSLEHYLMASCGLAPGQAREVSKKASRDASYHGSGRPLEELSYSRLYSASNPDAILDLLSGAGLSRADIPAVISTDPLLLRASVSNIAPRLAGLRDRVGLSAPQIVRFLLVDSRALRRCDMVPKLEFFISFYGSFEQVLVAAKRSMGVLLTSSLERVIKPNIALLSQWGVGDIAKLCSAKPWVLSSNPERLKELLLRAEELGVPSTSRMFRHAVGTVASMSKEKVAAKLEFFKRTLGCSQSEVSTAVSKMPKILEFSDKVLLSKIEFLVNEAQMEPKYIVENPVLLAMSLEKRLVPRHYVMKVLQEKGLLDRNKSFCSLAKIGEETFKSKFIDCHMESVPGLADAYAAALAVSKKPTILHFSDEILLRKIEFLVNEAAMEPPYIAERSVLLSYSLEKQLVPRHYVMKVLQEKGLLNTNMSFYTFVQFGEETFKSKFIDCHMESVPGLADAYAAACAH